MTMRRKYAIPVVVLVVALSALGGSIAWAATRDESPGFGMMRFGSGMMGSATVGSGEPVRDLAGARRQAGRFADRLDLRVGEVMRFDNQYYAELTADGRGATEVLIDPATGTVMLEPGPAMMWNTRYGMMRGTGMMAGARTGGGSTAPGPGGMMGAGGMMGGPASTPGPAGGAAAPATPAGAVTAAQASAIANRWLRDASPGLSAGRPEPFPGYFTIDTIRGDRIEGMLSVNAATGAVWYHSWHGRFIEMSE
jgi:hypothetical protein